LPGDWACSEWWIFCGFALLLSERFGYSAPEETQAFGQRPRDLDLLLLALAVAHRHLVVETQKHVDDVAGWRGNDSLSFHAGLSRIPPSLERLFLERGHVDHEAVSDIAFQHTFEGVIDLLDRN